MFSSRVPDDRRANRLSMAVAAARSAGRRLLDLTATNPTAVGIPYPASLLQPLAAPASLRYAPEPFGLASARAAAAREYRRRGAEIDPARIVLTASTSEAYSLLFKLLCDPGDAVLVPIPSYPLFDHLTRLDAVRSAAYRLEYHGRWNAVPAALDDAADDVGRTRAVLAVTPNNPTGSVMSVEELVAFDAWCAGRGAALILDEVFADYPLDPASRVPCRAADRALTFRLGGLSKSVGLPQLKLGWIAVDGPAPLVDEALSRLELICDTYLSVGTPVQVAAGDLLDGAAPVRDAILARVRANYAELRSLVAVHPEIDVLPADAGWSAVVRVPRVLPEEELVLRLVEQDGVLCHPGFFFDFPHEAFLIVSLLPDADVFAAAVRRILERVRG